ncbi:MAG: N-acetylmannosamine-6-phosphate 2-epimerase [Chloroflexota bacterium]
MTVEEFIEQVRGQLIVSCQALEDEPLHGAEIMVRMARAAQEGGAVAIRANSPSDVAAIKQAISLPLIGLYKDGDTGIYITPSKRHALAIADAGADIIALDATNRPRIAGESLAEIIATIHEVGALALADVSTLEEAHLAQRAGADFVAPTLAGYTEYSPQNDMPDFNLMRRMVTELTVPVIAEGHISTPTQARQALDCGVLAVVVGSAITRPQLITAKFANALKD